MTDWGTLSHAYGDAGDVPAMLTALRSGDAEQAVHDLWSSVLHQGTLYDATAPAVAEICTVLTNRSANRVRSAAWLVGQAVAAASMYPPDDERALAVRAAAEPGWAWAKRAIGTARNAETAAEVLAVHTDRAPAALELLTKAANRWPQRPVFLSAIHALDPESPVLTHALDDPDPRLAATAAILLINALGGPPDDALGERLITTAGRVLSDAALTTDLPDTPVKLIMTALTGVDPEYTEPEYPHVPAATGPAARLVGALLDSHHEPTATEAYVALTDRNLARSRGVAGWAANLVADRLGRPPAGPTADAMMLAAFALGPRLTSAADRVAAIDWARDSVAGGAAATLLLRLSPERLGQVPDWLDRGWGHPDLARAVAESLDGPLPDRLAAAVADRLARLGPPAQTMSDMTMPWHARTLDRQVKALRNNEFIEWQQVLTRGGHDANERLARLRESWPAGTVGLHGTWHAEHLHGRGDEAGARQWLIERVSKTNDHGLDLDWLWARPTDPAVLDAARNALSDLDLGGYVATGAVELAGWVAGNSDWDPAGVFAATAEQPWPAITMLGLRHHTTAFDELVTAAVPSAVEALRKPGQSLAAALVLRPDELSDDDTAHRARVLARLATRLPDRSAEAIALLAAEPATLAMVADELRSWLDGDETFDALRLDASAGFTDAELSHRLTQLLDRP